MNHVEILFIPKVLRGFQNCRVSDGEYQIHSSEGSVPWLSMEEKAIIKHSELSTVDDMIYHFSKVLGKQFQEELGSIVDQNIKNLKDLKLKLDSVNSSRGLYITTKYKLSPVSPSTEIFRQKLRGVVNRINPNIKINYLSIKVKGETTKFYIASVDEAKAYHQIEHELIRSGILDLADVLARKKLSKDIFYLKGYMNSGTENERVHSLVEVVICNSSNHPYSEYNFMLDDISKNFLDKSAYEPHHVRQILGYDSPKNVEDITRIINYF